jgi:Tol biopolymer transport system component
MAAPSPAFSPDGRWIAYLDRVPGRMADGLYLTHLDGSGRRLVAQLDYWPVSSVTWSPDGKWLVFTVLNTDLITPTSTAGLLNIESCQVVPLADLDGAIQSWVNP